MRTIVTACLVLAACAVADDARDAHDLAPIGQSGGGGAADGVCATVPAAIAPTNVPQYSCGALDAGNNALMTDLNAFWGSQVVACACGADFPNGCDGAFSLFDQGYIFIGQQFINDLATSSHSVMTAQYVYAHEFGHELEGHYGLYAATTQQRELTADCLAGYYLGSLICRGAATERDIVTTLRAACVIGDGTGNPITDLETHGTCEQRATSVAAGIDAYLTGQRPLDACAL